MLNTNNYLFRYASPEFVVINLPTNWMLDLQESIGKNDLLHLWLFVGGDWVVGIIGVGLLVICVWCPARSETFLFVHTALFIFAPSTNTVPAPAPAPALLYTPDTTHPRSPLHPLWFPSSRLLLASGCLHEKVCLFLHLHSGCMFRCYRFACIAPSTGSILPLHLHTAYLLAELFQTFSWKSRQIARQAASSKQQRSDSDFRHCRRRITDQATFFAPTKAAKATFFALPFARALPAGVPCLALPAFYFHRLPWTACPPSVIAFTA
jgi:hypothetical protein